MVSVIPYSPPRLVPLVEEMAYHALTPWEAARRLASLPHLVFFDSAAYHDNDLGRYSFVAADPFEWLRLAPTFGAGANPFTQLATVTERFSQETMPDLPPFQGGVAGLFSYDLCHFIERLPRPRFADFQIPDLAVGVYDWVLAWDHHQEKCWFISTGFPEKDRAARFRRALRRLENVWRLLEGPEPSTSWEPREPGSLAMPQYSLPGLPGLTSNFSRENYLAMVRRGIEYVHAGDCFQVNLAQRLLHPLEQSPLEVYERLRQRNAAPFAGYFDLGDVVIASASPERFLQVSDGFVQTRPIKGTRPRGSTPEEDAALARELLDSAKDRAENVMIVDLLRNDLGRVCAYGSVEVEALCRLESHHFVHHLVSEVQGRLRPNESPIDLLRAAFPGGSVTGAPKIRAMEIITELEQVARGPYCGCLGYLGFDGSMDTNLLIRTFTMAQGWIQFSVGGGIVADSVPEREYEETWHKAEGMVRALTD
jgi:para-aminobenzoate synthetase component 1